MIHHNLTPTLLVHESLSYNNQPRPLIDVNAIRDLVPKAYKGSVAVISGNGTRSGEKVKIVAPTGFSADQAVVSPLTIQAQTDYGFKPVHVLGYQIGKRKAEFAGTVIVDGNEPTVTKLAAYMTAATWHAAKNSGEEWFDNRPTSLPVRSHSLTVGVPEMLRKDAGFRGLLRDMADESRRTTGATSDYRNLRPTTPRNGEFDPSVFNVQSLSSFVFTAAKVGLPDQANREKEMLTTIAERYEQFAPTAPQLDTLYGGSPTQLATLYTEYVLNENSPHKAAVNMNMHLGLPKVS